ncbi:hypothetical protein OsJ_36537 [Oryza sativa Japonica Group]|uniref:Uncharacterized protein n=1 Tax=Oryza sativa subsp. japonica TaxID=39947 RepID=A3CII5_ORYSJ|nr:hypothetical protein OsJ_36537 [Oryza sativa Japonica Group]
MVLASYGLKLRLDVYELHCDDAIAPGVGLMHVGRIVSLPANLDFMIFNHRGRALPSDPDLKLKT